MNFFEYNYLQGLSAVEVAFVAHDARLASRSNRRVTSALTDASDWRLCRTPWTPL